MVDPPVAAQGNAQPAATLPDFVNPQVSHGDLTARIIQKCNGNKQQFVEAVVTKVDNMRPHLIADGATVNAHVLSQTLEPVAFLVITPPPAGETEQLVEVVHCVRQCLRNPNLPPDPIGDQVD